MVTFRPFSASDHNFIMNSWLKSWRNGPPRQLPNEQYYREQTFVVQQILANSRVVVACNPEDETQIFGYIVAQDSPAARFVHYLYVKQPYRRLGIARALVKETGLRAPLFTTHYRAAICKKLNIKRAKL
jgi:GNAT superfamily N-acetyltransferase